VREVCTFERRLHAIEQELARRKDIRSGRCKADSARPADQQPRAYFAFEIPDLP
jgi:hypothetical protein